MLSATASDVEAFDVCGPLPRGVTVLEASAGTGKTFTIATLAARFVAEGIPLEQILLVTFTRMATGELRDRVRERLVSAEHGLTRALAGVPPSDRDQVVGLLASGSDEDVKERRDRLTRAIADFDAATVATTHAFCLEVLGGLGVAGDMNPDTVFVEDVGDLVEEVVDDLYVRRFHWDAGGPKFGRDEALRIARTAVGNPVARIEPPPGRENVSAMRSGLAHAVRSELEHRKRRHSIMSYDDLLTRLAGTLTGVGGPGCVATLRDRYRVVLVDEFQDTDPLQWDIMRTAFGEGDGTLVLIGDPKQAIYAFRGADVYAYLGAARSADVRATLEVNWRSDQGLIDAYDALFGGAKLGHEGIVYRRVRAADANQVSRLTGAPISSPLRVRVVRRDDPAVEETDKGYASAPSAREFIAKDLAADLLALLSSPSAQVEVRSKEGTAVGREPLRPRHVAVLVRTHRTAALVREALDDVGIPAVINGAGSVFATTSARDWLRLLEALERPTFASRAASAALTPFLGWSASRLATMDEAEREELHRTLHGWARVLRLKGVAALMETITLREELPGRVLAAVEGERRLTDLRHVAQLLHSAAATERLGVTALAAWLRRRISEAEQDTDDEERSRRLESDAEAVQVLTIHRSKGLEFPIVYCPFLWESTYLKPRQPVFFHDPDAEDERTIDVGLQGAGYARHRRQFELEQRGEDLRLAYVALTRAQNQAVLWWAGSWEGRHSPLSRLLFAREEGGDVPPAGTSVASDEEAIARLEALAGEAPGCVSIEEAKIGPPGRWRSTPERGSELSTSRFDRALDWSWRRTSYSGITARYEEGRVASEPEEPLDDDEAATGLSGAGAGGTEGDERLRAVPSLLSELPVGSHIGTFVHRLLEVVDFTAADIRAELERHVTRMQRRRPLEVGDTAALLTGLTAAFETPLGPLAGDRRLRDIERPDRLDELRFELPLVGGDVPSGRLGASMIGTVLRRHLEPNDPLIGYADRLDDPTLEQNFRGYLTGSIDLIARLRSEDDAVRFAIVDYKTNWLAPPGEELTAWHHRPSALAAEMRAAHYGLQGLLYTVALHRYLRWRLPGYEPDRHLAGVFYLFLRGMTGPDTPRVAGAPCGVFAWSPPPGLVEDLSDVLDRGEQA